jgi:hypothetical protein
MQQLGHDFEDESRYRQHVGSPIGNSPPGISCTDLFFFFFFEKCHVCPDFVYLATDLCLHFSLVNNNVTALPYNLNTSYHQLI